MQITDSERDHADMVTDKEHGKKDEERKDVHISNVINKQSNDAYIGLKAKFRNIDQNPKIANDETEHVQISRSLSNTMKTKDGEDANIDSTKDGTVDNPNPSTLDVNNSITRLRLEVENNKFIKANGRRILKNTTCSTSIRDLLDELTSKKEETVLSNSETAVNDTSIEKLEAISDKALVTVVHRTDDIKNIIEDEAFSKLGSTGPSQARIEECDIHTETMKNAERTSSSDSIDFSEAERIIMTIQFLKSPPIQTCSKAAKKNIRKC